MDEVKATKRNVSAIRSTSPATSPESAFRDELEIFRRETEAAKQFLYAYLAVRAVADGSVPVYRLLNSAPLFWNTNLAALQASTFVTLGRMFDQGSNHNVDRLLRLAQRNSEIFSKMALGLRKQRGAPNPPSWLFDYLQRAYVPRPDDFRRLRAHVAKKREIYQSRYQQIRNKVFAHLETADGAAMFAQTNIRELQRLLVFLSALHDSLWQLFENGRALHRPGDGCATYNCHGLTFAARRTWIESPSEIAKILRDDDYISVPLDQILPGDVAVWHSAGAAVHSGIVVSLSGLQPTILSKWGKCHEVVHRLSDCPYQEYPVAYYRVVK